MARVGIASEYLQEHFTNCNIRRHPVPLLRQSIYSRLAVRIDYHSDVMVDDFYVALVPEAAFGLCLGPNRIVHL